MKRQSLVCLVACLVAACGTARAGDYVIRVENNTTVTNEVIQTTDRVVIEAGTGTVVLRDGNTFGSEVVVSNGFLAADYAASGLSATHLTLVGTANSRPAIFCAKGPSLTAPLAASGAGTITLVRYAGFAPYDQPLTVNLGGDGSVLTNRANGFFSSGYAEFDMQSRGFDLTFENSVEMNGADFTLKNPSKNNRTYFKGRLVNSSTTGTFQYWDGTTVFVGQPGREDITWKKNCKFYARCGNLLFTNCKLRPHNDFICGDSDVKTPVHVTYGPGCDHYADSAWDKFAAYRGSTMTVDGGTYDHNLILFLGDSTVNANKYDLEGNLVITNNGTVKLGTFCLHHGSVNQYSGLFSVPNDGKHGDGNEVRIGGFRASSTPQQGAGPSVYNLWGGTFDVSSRVWMHIGSAETGTFNVFGGEASEHHPLCVGYHAAGTGTLNVHGGVFRQTKTEDAALRVGVSGTGTVSVANGGRFVGAGPLGVQIGANAGSKGRVFLDPLGELETTRIYAGSGTSSLIFNGGTLKANSAGYASTFVTAAVGEVAVTPLGGAIDTAGLGDFTLAKALTASNGRLAHHWPFAGGSLADDVGSSDAVTSGAVTRVDGRLVFPGGVRGSGCLKLGASLIPTGDSGWTYEMWFTQTQAQPFTRLLQIGLTKDEKSIFVAANRGNNAPWYIGFAAQENRTGKYVIQNGVPYHLSVVITRLPSNVWQLTAELRNAQTGELCESLVKAAPSDAWTPSKLQQSDGLWIGNCPWNDPDPSVELCEVRMHDRALDAAELAASAAWPRARRFFAKKGVGSLTLTGANAYAAGTAVEAGTLKVAAGASLPATALKVAAGGTLDLSAQGAVQTAASLQGAGTVKGGSLAVAGDIRPGDGSAVGTMTLDGTALTGNLAVKVAADGSCDVLSGTGSVDLGGLVLSVANPEALDRTKTYSVVRGESVTGSFAGANLPRGWTVAVSATEVRLFYSGGLRLFVR